MDKVVSVSTSFAEADRRDKAYYQSLSPLQRLEILFELNRRWPANDNVDDPQRVERVYRIIKLP
jgi:hypothetical protein